MEKMKLYNPSNLVLPPLKITKKKDRKLMEKNPKVKNFIGSNLLLNKKFNKLFLEILVKSKEIEKRIEAMIQKPIKKEKIFDDIWRENWEFESKVYSYHSKALDEFFKSSEYDEIMKKENGEAIEEIENDRVKEILRKVPIKLIQERNKKFLTKIKKLSNQIQNALSKFEENKNINLEILTPVNLFFCVKCNRIVSRNQFRRTTCACTEKIKTVKQTIQETITYFEKELIDLIQQNYWFEHGVDYLLRKKNFETLCGYHVLGHSGNLHEIDNIAESKSLNLRFFCECKTTGVGSNDIFVLAGKMTDIGCTRGYFFTSESNFPRQVYRLARSRNISIIENVLEKSESDLLEEIIED
ncbi:MAG TPA: restriction endonuclease [Nitrospinota bacterium]|nr:restriction endonuclease [Nitrospinota bacterium]